MEQHVCETCTLLWAQTAAWGQGDNQTQENSTHPHETLTWGSLPACLALSFISPECINPSLVGAKNHTQECPVICVCL